MTQDPQSYLLVRRESPKLDEILFEGINHEAQLAKNLRPMRTFGLCVEDTQQNLVGGATGVTYYGCLYVDMLWLASSLRHKGWGTKLMQEAESIGKEQGCTFATVATMDFEALSFYQKLGYVIEFTREGYANNTKMYMLRKPL